MRGCTVAAATLAVLAAVQVHAQSVDETVRRQIKSDHVAAMEQAGPRVRSLLPPGRSTETRDYLGFELHQGGVYEPTIFPNESWLWVACIHADLETAYDRTKHGSSLLRIHAIVYDSDLNKIHDTIDTTAIDEAICNLSFSIDTSFVELPRTVGSRAAAVAFIAVPAARQYVEPTKIVYRTMPRREATDE